MLVDKNQVRAVRCDIYSRICGYFTPTNLWNLGKKDEFALRHVISNMDVERAVERSNDNADDNHA